MKVHISQHVYNHLFKATFLLQASSVSFYEHITDDGMITK